MITREAILAALDHGPRSLKEIARELGCIKTTVTEEISPEFREVVWKMVARHELEFTKDWSAMRSVFDNRVEGGKGE